MRTSYVRFVPTSRDQWFPVGRVDFVVDDERTSDSELRPQGDGRDAVPDDAIKDGGVRPEVEIKRRKMDSGVEIDDVTDHSGNERLQAPFVSVQ